MNFVIVTLILIIVFIIFVLALGIGIYNFILSLRTGRRNHFNNDYTPPTRPTATRQKSKSSWKDDYNAGLKAGREDALFHDGYGYFHPKGKQSDAYRAGFQAGHDEEVENW